MFLVDKQYGTIKARTCYDGSKKIRDDRYNNHDYASPTCANNSVVITSSLEAKEGRDVAIRDILVVCLHTYVEKNGKQIIIMFLNSKLAYLMVMVDPYLYRKYVPYFSKGNSMLRV